MTDTENDALYQQEQQYAITAFKNGLRAIPSLSGSEQREVMQLVHRYTLETVKAVQRHIRNGLAIAGAL